MEAVSIELAGLKQMDRESNPLCYLFAFTLPLRIFEFRITFMLTRLLIVNYCRLIASRFRHSDSESSNQLDDFVQ